MTYPPLLILLATYTEYIQRKTGLGAFQQKLQGHFNLALLLQGV